MDSAPDLPQLAREFLADRGIDPETVPPRPPYTLATHMADTTEATLDAILPTRYRHAEPDDPDVLAWVDSFLADPRTAPNLLILGPVGSGKTYQALGALRRVALACAARCQRVAYRAITHPEFNARMRPQPDESHSIALMDMQAVDLLVLDDLGSGKATDWTDDTLYRLIDTRWSHQRPTIATTNLHADEIRDVLDERVVSRLACGVQVALTAADRRSGGAP